MKHKNWIIIWQTRLVVLYASLTVLVYGWAAFSYKDYSSTISYWLLFACLIPLVSLSNLIFVSVIVVKDHQLIVYRLAGKTRFHRVAVSYGRKVRMGAGKYSFSSYPIWLSGTVLTKQGKEVHEEMTLVCGYFANKRFTKFYHSLIKPILPI